MALTETQKTAVRFAFGYDRGRDIHPTLETRFDPFFNATEETKIGAILTQIDAILAKMQDSALVNLDLASGDGVTFLGPEQLEALSDHGRRLVQQLNTFFQVPILRDIFAGDGGTGGLIQIG